MAELDELKAFNFREASVVLWTYKVSGSSTEAPRYNGRWVETTQGVQNVLKTIATDQANLIEETLEYSLTAQNNEGSALTLQAELTHAGLLIDAAAEELENKKVKKLSELQNSLFYSMKFVLGDETVFAIRKADKSWKTARTNEVRRAFFADEKMTLDDRSPFEIEQTVDLFIFRETVFLRSKNRSETVLRYKQAHIEDFATLQAEAELAEVFSDMSALIAYIGNNKMQLRRAAAIRQKAHYKDDGFMERLRAKYGSQKLDIQFDVDGKIVATEDSAADIMTALLDHRLSSVFSESIYDVQDTQPVN